MIKKLMSYIGEFKRDTILSPIFVTLEVFLEVLLPTLMALVIDNGVETGDMNYVMKIGLIMLVVAMLSLAAGTLSGVFAAKASMGFGRNLRRGMFDNIQDFAFRNIDHFSTAGLVTRMTTDVTNVQNAYQMLVRMFVRAPIMMISALIMCVKINARISLVFLAALVFLGLVLSFVIRRAFPLFNEMFRGYDSLNASVQENLTGIRVVKAYVREDHENDKFCKATDRLKNLSVHAEKLVIMNQPGHAVNGIHLYSFDFLDWCKNDCSEWHHDHWRTYESLYLYHADSYESDDDVHGICHGHHGKFFCKAYYRSAG